MHDNFFLFKEMHNHLLDSNKYNTIFNKGVYSNIKIV